MRGNGAAELADAELAATGASSGEESGTNIAAGAAAGAAASGDNDGTNIATDATCWRYFACRSQSRLRNAVRAFGESDCRRSLRATRSRSMLRLNLRSVRRRCTSSGLSFARHVRCLAVALSLLSSSTSRLVIIPYSTSTSTVQVM